MRLTGIDLAFFGGGATRGWLRLSMHDSSTHGPSMQLQCSNVAAADGNATAAAGTTGAGAALTITCTANFGVGGVAAARSYTRQCGDARNGAPTFAAPAATCQQVGCDICYRCPLCLLVRLLGNAASAILVFYSACLGVVYILVFYSACLGLVPGLVLLFVCAVCVSACMHQALLLGWCLTAAVGGLWSVVCVPLFA